VTLEPAATIGGHVVRSDGSGVENATVVVGMGTTKRRQPRSTARSHCRPCARSARRRSRDAGGRSAKRSHRAHGRRPHRRRRHRRAPRTRGRQGRGAGDDVSSPRHAAVVGEPRMAHSRTRMVDSCWPTCPRGNRGDVSANASSRRRRRRRDRGRKATDEISFTLLRGRTHMGGRVRARRALEEVEIGDERESNRWTENGRYEVRKPAWTAHTR